MHCGAALWLDRSQVPTSTSGRSVFWLNSDQAGPRAVTVTLAATCVTSGAVRIPSDQAGAERFEHPLSLQPRFTLMRT